MESDTPADPLNDGDLAFLRYARFGALPSPVREDQRVELAETDAKRDWPEDVNRAQSEALQSGG